MKSTPQLKLSVREMCLLSLIGALMFAMQVAMSPFANIHVTDVIIIVTAVFFGWKVMYPIFVFCMLEGLYWGFGLWTLCYFYLWPILGAAAVLLRKNDSALEWAIVAAIHGITFGAMSSLPYIFIGGWHMAFSMLVSGLMFDIKHCAGNFVLTLLLYTPLMRAMRIALKGTKLL